MARARNIKPSFFTNEILGSADPYVGLLFAGLWCLADKDGILEDRPLRIKAELFPYRDGFDINRYLTVLQQNAFIERYVVGSVAYIKVINFEKHQHPHHTEKPRGYPQPQAVKEEYPLTPLSNGDTPSDSLIPDSLIPDSGFTDSGFTDSLIPDSKPLAPAIASAPAKKPEVTDEFRAACAKTWGQYSSAYFDRYGTEPVRNQKINKNVVDFCKRLSQQEAPDVARWFVGHSDAFYVRQMHDFGLLLKDCEKLRTEWATGRRMTQTQARQADRAGNTGSIIEQIKAERKVAS